MPSRLFDGLDASISDSVLQHPQNITKTFAKGEVMFDKEHFSHNIGVMLSGSAKVTNRDQGVVLRILMPGDCFGVASQFVDADTYVSCIVAQENSTVHFLSEVAVLEGIRTSSAFAENYLRFLTQRIRYLNGLIDAYSSPSVDTKLARYLLILYDSGKTHLNLKMTELSRMLGVGRASLYRTWDRFSEEGWVRRDGKEVVLLNVEALKQL